MWCAWGVNANTTHMLYVDTLDITMIEWDVRWILVFYSFSIHFQIVGDGVFYLSGNAWYQVSQPIERLWLLHTFCQFANQCFHCQRIANAISANQVSKIDFIIEVAQPFTFKWLVDDRQFSYPYLQIYKILVAKIRIISFIKEENEQNISLIKEGMSDFIANSLEKCDSWRKISWLLIY